MVAINLALIDGDYFADEHVDALEAAINTSDPAGRIEMYCGATAPTGWLLLNGAAVTNANTTYPDLWAVVPASWKSGTTLNLPNIANRFPIGQGTTSLGATGGANTKTIAEANLPSHTHAAGTLATSSTGSHSHGGVTGTTQVTTGQGSGGGSNAGYVTSVSISASISAANNVTHDHTISADGTHSHTMSGSTGAIGSGTALDVTNAHLALNFIIRAY